MIRTLFWDVGGVLLTNGWDREQRRRAIEAFDLDEEDFSERHQRLVAAFETGRMSLADYLERTVFHRPRPFTREAFAAFMLAQSRAHPGAIALARELAATGRYLMATLNNESRELNLHRIERFGLRAIFRVFLSSCFVGARKPDEAIYRLALDVTQTPAEACCVLDDRAANLEVADRLGMRVVEFRDAPQARRELARIGIRAREPAGRRARARRWA